MEYNNWELSVNHKEHAYYGNCENNVHNRQCSFTSTDTIFYGLDANNVSLLTCLNIPNGSSLTRILETIDSKICNLQFPRIIGNEGLGDIVTIRIENNNGIQQLRTDLDVRKLLMLIKASFSSLFCNICSSTPTPVPIPIPTNQPVPTPVPVPIPINILPVPFTYVPVPISIVPIPVPINVVPSPTPVPVTPIPVPVTPVPVPVNNVPTPVPVVPVPVPVVPTPIPVPIPTPVPVPINVVPTPVPIPVPVPTPVPIPTPVPVPFSALTKISNVYTGNPNLYSNNVNVFDSVINKFPTFENIITEVYSTSGLNIGDTLFKTNSSSNKYGTGYIAVIINNQVQSIQLVNGVITSKQIVTNTVFTSNTTKILAPFPHYLNGVPNYGFPLLDPTSNQFLYWESIMNIAADGLTISDGRWASASGFLVRKWYFNKEEMTVPLDNFKIPDIYKGQIVDITIYISYSNNVNKFAYTIYVTK